MDDSMNERKIKEESMMNQSERREDKERKISYGNRNTAGRGLL